MKIHIALLTLCCAPIILAELINIYVLQMFVHSPIDTNVQTDYVYQI